MIAFLTGPWSLLVMGGIFEMAWALGFKYVDRHAPFWQHAAVLAALVLGGVLSAGGAALESRPSASEGERSIADVSGHEVAVRRYARIASASTIADQVLAEIAEPSRVVAIAAHTRRIARTPWRYEGKAEVPRLDDREELLALDPDLVLASGFADPGQVARLRRAGLTVFDLGPMHGVESLLEDIRTLGALIDEPERGEGFAVQFGRRLRHLVAVGAPPAKRWRRRGPIEGETLATTALSPAAIAA